MFLGPAEHQVRFKMKNFQLWMQRLNQLTLYFQRLFDKLQEFHHSFLKDVILFLKFE